MTSADAIIGAALLDPSVVDDVDLDVQHFADGLAREAWSAILTLRNHGGAIDPITVGDESGHPDVMTYCSRCLIDTTTTANVGHHAGVLRRELTTRQVLAACSEIEERHRRSELQGDELLGEARRLLSRISSTNRDGAVSSPERLRNEAARRRDLTRRCLKFHVSYLDDCCRALMPHDLVLIAARTGAGKTTLAEIIATANAADGKRVHYFALEAEPDEIERHLKFRWIARRQWEQCRIEGFNYADWYLGTYDDALGYLAQEADDALATEYQTLQTYYRKREFTHADIKRLFLAVRDDTDLIVLDHLHYVDAPEGSTENQAQKELVKVIRECALAIGVPIVVVAHLRKKGTRKTLMPDADDVMGSSDITKIATRLILLAPAINQTRVSKWRYPTYMYVEKDRLCGTSRLVALTDYNLMSGRYEVDYYLGEMDILGENFTTVNSVPGWARRAKCISA